MRPFLIGFAALFLLTASVARADDGIVDTRRHTTLVAPVDGQDVELFDRIGAKVEQGDVLARFDTRALELDAKMTELERESQRVLLDVIERRIHTLKQRVTASQRDVDRIKAAVKAAVAGPEDLERAQGALDEARSDVDVLMLERRREQLRLEMIDTQLKAVRLQLERSVVRAPFSGVVAALHAVQGDTLVAKESPLLSIVDLEHLHVIVEVSPAALPSWKPGTPVRISVRVGREDVFFQGEVDRLSPTVDPERQLLAVFVIFEAPPNVQLLPGTKVTASYQPRPK